MSTKSKQLIERALPFNQKYVYLSITRGSILSGQVCTCDNCGQIITNMVTVLNRETKKQYTIGTDCAETLSKAKCLYNNGEATDFYLDIYSYNQCARFVTEIKAGCNHEFNGMQYVLINRKGKQLTCWKHDLDKFFPEYSL